MHRVLLATSARLPDGEPGGHLVTAALAARGVDAAWVVWDDRDVDWAAAQLVAVRSTWDYHRRVPEFLAWARDVESRTELLNGAEVFAWNADQGYLVDLGRVSQFMAAPAIARPALDLPHVPTALLDDPAGLPEATARWGSCVVKPRVGASGVGVVVVDGPGHEPDLGQGPWVVQPLVESVRTVGETSVFVFGGRATSQVDKLPGRGEVRVHEEYGGRSVAVALDPERAALAERAVASVGEWSGRVPAYARIDVMRWEGDWAVSELELIEPGLYLDVDPAPAEAFADAVANLLPG
jgi:hypothetical protein